MRKLFSVVVASLLLGVCTTAGATRVLYELTALSPSGRYEYTYSVVNDTLGIPISEFSIFFSYGVFTDLTPVSTPADWDPLTVDPATILGAPVDGFYDALTWTAPIGPGATLGGFSVEFYWSGAGLPGPQAFEVVDPETFEMLQSGITRPAVSMPEPGSLLLLAIGLVGIRAMRSSIRKPVRSGN